MENPKSMVKITPQVGRLLLNLYKVNKTVRFGLQPPDHSAHSTSLAHGAERALRSSGLPGGSLNTEGLVSMLIAKFCHHFIELVAKLREQRPISHRTS